MALWDLSPGPCYFFILRYPNAISYHPFKTVNIKVSMNTIPCVKKNLSWLNLVHIWKACIWMRLKTMDIAPPNGFLGVLAFKTISLFSIFCINFIVEIIKNVNSIFGMICNYSKRNLIKFNFRLIELNETI